MTTPTPRAFDEAQQLRRLSARMAAFCLALGVVLPPAVALYWALASDASLAALGHLAPDAIHGPLAAWQRVAGALCNEVPVLLTALGLLQARRSFAGFAQGEVFTAQAVLGLRGFAAWMFASACAALPVGTVLSVLLTAGNPPGARHLSVALGSSDLFTLLFAGTVWLMAAVIGQGRALAEENAAFL